MRTRLFLGIFIVAFSAANAQTLSLTTTTPASSATTDGGTSLRLGTSAGNGTLSTGGNNTFVGYQSGKVNTSGSNNTFLGKDSGKANTSGVQNLFFGSGAGSSNTTGAYNVFCGNAAGSSNTTGGNNTYFGNATGDLNATGNGNIFVGNSAGQSSGGGNVSIGDNAGHNGVGNTNIFIGTYSGFECEGTGNVFVGNEVGRSGITESNKLLIDNSDNATPLIWGDFAANQLKLNGKVGTGNLTAFPTTVGTADVSAYSLFAKGGILTNEIRVLATGWADYVFAKDYKLPTLAEVEKHIKENGHLKNVPSEKEVKENGIELGEITKIQQEKIEELTLYIIEQHKINEKQSQQIEDLIERINNIEKK